MALTVKQRGVLQGIIIGAAISIAVIAGAIIASPTLLSPQATAGERLAFALRADAFIALWLAISVGLLARHRFFSPEDIDGGGLSRGTETASVLQATLQNTLEQTVLAVLMHLAWASLMPVSWLAADTRSGGAVLVRPSAVRARLSRRGTVAGVGLCADFLSFRAHAHRRGRRSRNDDVLKV